MSNEHTEVDNVAEIDEASVVAEVQPSSNTAALDTAALDTAENENKSSEPGTEAKAQSQSAKASTSTDSPLLTSFLAQLTQSFSALELKKHWRIMSTGLFVDAELLQKLLKSLAEFRARETKSSIAIDDRILNLLFGSTFPAQYYLLEGKICLVGHFISFGNTDQLKLNIPFFRGSLIDCKDQLHPRDPWLSNLSDVESSLDRNGFSVKLKIADQKLVISNAGLADFHQVLCNAPRLRSRYRAATRSLRDSLVPLGKLLKSASLVGPKQTLLIPDVFRQDRQVRFYRLAGLVFVVLEGVLLTAYELRGRNLLKMLDDELMVLKSKRTYRVGAIELSRKPGAIVGAIHTPDGEHNLIHIQTILRMLELTLRRRTLRRQVKARLTLFDLLKLLSNLLCETVRIEPREVPYAILKSYLNLQARKEQRNFSSKNNNRKSSAALVKKNRRKNSGATRNSSSTQADKLRYRSGAGWIFFIHDRRVIKSMLERRAQVSPTVKIIGKVPPRDSAE